MPHEVVGGLYFTGEAWFEVNPDPGAVVVLGGFAIPGIATVKAPKFEAKIDSKESKGANGAKISFDGAKSAETEIEIMVWTSSQYAELVAMLSVLKPPDGKGEPQPWGVVYPFFNDVGISSVVVKEVEGPGFGKQKGTYEAKLKVMEWRPTWAKPGSDSPTEAKPAVPTVNTVFDGAVSASGAVGPPPPPPPTEAGPPPP